MTQSNTYSNDNSLSKYLRKTFLTVALGVGISAISAEIGSILTLYVAYFFPAFYSIGSILLLLAELGTAFYFSLRLNQMSKSRAWTYYILYSVVTGLSFGSILLVYADSTVALAFLATTIMFICMAIIGYTSNFDFRKIYVLLLPALLAGSIISLINAFFIHSTTTDMIIVYIGLVLFLVVTAADVQKLKDMYYAGQYNSEISEKYMIMGAFQLYLDFVNLFIKILRVLGFRSNNRNNNNNGGSSRYI